MLKQQHQAFAILLSLVDSLVAASACYAAWMLRRMLIEGFWPQSWENYFKEPMVISAVPLTILLMWAFGLYKPRRDHSSIIGESLQILKATMIATASLIVVLWAFGNDELIGGKGYGPATIMGMTVDAGRLQFGLLAIGLPLFLTIHRVIFRLTLRQIRKRGRNLRHVAIVGTGRLGRIVCQTLDRNSWTGIHVKYFVDHSDQAFHQTCLGRPVLGGISDLQRVLESDPVDAVYLAIPNRRAAIMPRVLKSLDRFALDVRIVPDVQPRYLPQRMVLGELDGMPILSYRESPTTGLGGITKRIVDVAGASLGLVLLMPLLVLIGLIVRRTSPGPMIFKQRRVSLGGQTFKIYKFRTMYHVADEAGPAMWTKRDDSRVTPIGRWLRKTSLDELPQLLNVVKGQMSLVGPRPERPELINRFREDWRGYMLRQHVRAGMTGWAQVQGLRGDTSLRKRLQYDLFYVRNWSLGFDMKILWLTIFRGFVNKNAH